jgi:hypothetical protein
MISRTHHPRAVLTESQAIEIYTYRKIDANSPKRDQCLLGRSSALAKKFNVSPKTIRDIWNRRTWTHETQHLWTGDERPIIRPERVHKTSLSTRSTLCDQHQQVPTRWTSSSIYPESAINSSCPWHRQTYPPIANSCSVYTDDIEQQSHFHSLSIWSHLLSASIPTGSVETNLPPIPPQTCAAFHRRRNRSHHRPGRRTHPSARCSPRKWRQWRTRRAPAVRGPTQTRGCAATLARRAGKTGQRGATPGRSAPPVAWTPSCSTGGRGGDHRASAAGGLGCWRLGVVNHPDGGCLRQAGREAE